MIRDRSLLALLSGEFVSRLGSQFTLLALPWFVLVTTHSAGRMSVVFAVGLAPIALLGIPSAALVERFGPTNVTNLLGPVLAGVLIAGTLFVNAGPHGTYMVVAALSTFASVNFILAVSPFAGNVGQEAA